MGTWGAGNFDSDTAADHLSILAARVLEELEAAFAGAERELEADEYWGVAVPCNVELLALFAEQRWVGNTLPTLATARGWKARYLAIWERSIDALSPKPGWKQERRSVIAATFDRLAEACAREEPAEPAPKRAAASKRAAVNKQAAKKPVSKKPPAKKPTR